MNSQLPSIPLDDGLDLGKLIETGTVLNINLDYDDIECQPESDEANIKHEKELDFIGKPVKSFVALEKLLTPVDPDGYVKKKILEEGGGEPLHDGCTVSIAYSGYWENELEPFDIAKSSKPIKVNLAENGLLPGMEMAVRSMLVGEVSLFLLSYQLMYGEYGVPPRIKAKANCVFYIKLVKSILTPQDGEIDYSAPNSFQRVFSEVKQLFHSGREFYKSNNVYAAIKMFQKGINILHKCRLANEKEEKQQEKMLVKLYFNSAVCYNHIKSPLKACICCNELNRLDSLWNNPKALFQQAKALRMVEDYNNAKKRLKRILKLSPDDAEQVNEEFELIQKLQEEKKRAVLCKDKCKSKMTLISEQFKIEIDNLISNFKINPDVSKLALPSGLNSDEVAYVRDICIRENLFCNSITPEDSEEQHV